MNLHRDAPAPVDRASHVHRINRGAGIPAPAGAFTDERGAAAPGAACPLGGTIPHARCYVVAGVNGAVPPACPAMDFGTPESARWATWEMQYPPPQPPLCYALPQEGGAVDGVAYVRLTGAKLWRVNQYDPADHWDDAVTEFHAATPKAGALVAVVPPLALRDVLTSTADGRLRKAAPGETQVARALEAVPLLGPLPADSPLAWVLWL